MVVCLPQQVVVGSNSAGSDQQLGTQARPAFQPVISPFHMVSRVSSKEQELQTGYSQTGSTIQYGASQHFSAQQLSAAVKQVDTKTGHANPPPEAATVAAAVAVAGRSMQFDKSVLPSSRSDILPPYNASVVSTVGDSVTKGNQSGFAQFLATCTATSSPTVMGSITSGTATTISDSSQLKSMLIRPSAVSAPVTSKPFTFDLSSLSKTGSLSNPSVFTISSQPQGESSGEQSFQFTMPSVFTSTTSAAVPSTSFPPSMAGFIPSQGSRVSVGFDMKLTSGTGFAFNSSFGATGTSKEPFAFGGHTCDLQVPQEDPKLHAHEESSSHQSNLSVQNFDSGSGADRQPPPPYAEPPPPYIEPPALQGRSDKLERPPAMAESAPRQSPQQPPIVTSSSAPVIPDSTVSTLPGPIPSNTTALTNTGYIIKPD